MRLPALILLALAFQTVPSTPEPRFFHFQRQINVNPGTATQACAPLDATLFAHASPTLADLRLYSPAQQELPFAITTSRSTLLPPDPARLLNLGLKGKHIAFDLAMPSRPFTGLNLHLSGQNFLATAAVTGLKSLEDPHPTALGTSTLFDLTSQHLARSSSIPFPESSFPFLHLDLTVTPTPGSTFQPTPAMVQGASVPPNREAQTLYTPVAAATHFEQHGRESVTTLELPAHVPVERITFALAPEPAGRTTNFSRPIRITASASSTPPGRNPSEPEMIAGDISRVHLTEAGQPIREASLSLPATLGENAESPARVEVLVENGDDRPLPLASATLEMRQRSVCFEAPPASAPPTLTLLYGEETLNPPVYDFARLFNPAAPTRPATLTAEHPNPLYIPRPTPRRPFTERHPELLWLALLAVIAVLAVVAFRSSKHIHPHP